MHSVQFQRIYQTYFIFKSSYKISFSSTCNIELRAPFLVYSGHLNNIPLLQVPQFAQKNLFWGVIQLVILIWSCLSFSPLVQLYNFRVYVSFKQLFNPTIVIKLVSKRPVTPSLTWATTAFNYDHINFMVSNTNLLDNLIELMLFFSTYYPGKFFSPIYSMLNPHPHFSSTLPIGIKISINLNLQINWSFLRYIDVSDLQTTSTFN